jgi:S1-C subfamily serine protease
LAVADLDQATLDRMDLPLGSGGVRIIRIEPLSSSFDAEIERGSVLLEINREPIGSATEYRRIARAVRPGDVLALYIVSPGGQREIKTIRVEDR